MNSFPCLLLTVLTVLMLSTSACSNMQFATGSRIQTTTTPGTGPTPLQSDAQRTAIYNGSGQTALPAPGTQSTPPLNQQTSDVNTYRPAGVPANQSPNITPETRTQQQVTLPPLAPRP